MPYVPPVDWRDQDPTTALTAGNMKAMEASLAAWSDTKVPKDLVDAKGDLLVASGANAVARMAVAGQGAVLQTDSTATNGLAWVDKPTIDVGDPYFSLPTNGTSNAATAINVAGNLAAFQGGGVVRVPPGPYTLTAPIHHNFNSRVFWDLRGCRFTISGANQQGFHFNPGVLGEAGLGGGCFGGHFTCTAATQVGVKIRSGQGFRLADTRIDTTGPAFTGLLFSNDGASKYNERHVIENVHVTSSGTGCKWEVINGGDPSMEEQIFINCWFGFTSRGFDIGAGVSMQSVTMPSVMLQTAGTGGTAIYTGGAVLRGWRGRIVVEALPPSASGIVVMNNAAGTTYNYETQLDIHTVGSGFAAARFVKDAGIPFPTIVTDGPIKRMGGANGGWVESIHRDYEAQPRLRRSYSGFEAGPGGTDVPDTTFNRASANQWTIGTGNITVGDGTAATDTVAVRQAVGQVNHGATAGTARPTGFTTIQWIGSVEPTNAVNGDTWISTA